MGEPSAWYKRCVRTPRYRFWMGLYHLSNRLRSFFAWFKWNLGWEWVWWSTQKWTARLGHIGVCHSTSILNAGYQRSLHE